ncbi:MAG: hypothetical protein ACREJ6_04135, partial [Candidatus Methylomirabilis sp.]
LEVLFNQVRPIDRLIGEGAFAEDSRFRYRSHFHNPLLPWDRAGLDSPFLPRFQSSVVWQQNPDQNNFLIGGGNWSWQDARQRYLSALTGVGLPQSTKEHRDQALADTFLTLGHLTHLIQDASVPAHSRNDSHFVFEGYESWVEEARTDLPGARAIFLQYLAPPGIKPPLTIFSPGRQEAPIPIARLIDSDKFDPPGNFGPLLDPALGIAEYSSGNFLSDDTIFTDFILPRRESLDLNSPFLEPVGSKFQRYFPKVAEGQRIAHFVAESALYKDASESAGQPISDALTLTRRVYRDYAAELVPRAVGYSAALLDYFFRGKLEATIAADPGDSQGLQLTGKNASGEALKDGTLEVYGDYPGGERRPLASWTNLGSVAPGADLSGQPLKFRPEQPIPSRYMVVYKGDLGEEKKDPTETATSFVGGVIGKAVKYGGVIEQLFVNEADGDVYFRNGTLVTRLNVRAQLRPGSRVTLRSWGARNDTFLVEGRVPGEGVVHFYVFMLNRPGPDQVFRDPPLAALVRGPELLDLQHGLPFGPGGITPLDHLAALDDNLDVILPGYYIVYIPNPYDAYLTDIHGVLVNNTSRTVLFDLKASDLGAPTPDSGPGPSSQSAAVPAMILRLDAARPGESRIVVNGSQVDRTRQFLGYLGVVDGNGKEVAPLVDWEPFQSPELLGRQPQRGGRHLLWAKFDDNDRDGTTTQTYLTHLDDGTSTQVGVGDAEWDLVGRASLLPVAPDYLLRTTSPTYFVRGWTANGTVVLPWVTTPGFPPEDPDLASLKRLADPPPGVSIPTETSCVFGSCSAWQVIEDADLLR